MGYLLKEALKTLCGVNQWSYAVFWKIGYQNPKLLIWEECYYEPITYSGLPRICGFENSEVAFEEWEACWLSADACTSRFRVQEGGKVHLLVNKMMMDNHIKIVGEGLVGRAAFTGNHQWILLENYAREAHPPEVLNEACQQFSAGMQTVAVVPVLPHGVVQLGSSLAIMENMGFVNDVKNLILQLGCVPGVLLSDNYATKEPAPKVTSSATCIADSCNQQSNSPQASEVFGQTSYSPIQDCLQSMGSTLQDPNMIQSFDKSHDYHCEEKVLPVMKTNLPSTSQPENGVTKAEVIPSNPQLWLNKYTSFYIPRSGFDEQLCVGPSTATNGNVRSMEKRILSDNGVGDHISNGNSISDGFMMSQMGTNVSLVSSSCKDSVTNPLVEAIDLHNGVASHLSSISNRFSLSNANRSPNNNISCTPVAGSGLQNADSSKAEVYFSTTNHLLSGSSDTRFHSTEGKCTQTDLVAGKGRIETDLFQTLGNPLSQPDEYMSLTGHVPGFVHDSQKHGYGMQSRRLKNAKYGDGCVLPTSGDDLFDILGVDFKNKLLNDSWNNFVNNGLDTKSPNLDKSHLKLQDAGSDIYSVNEGTSDSGIFSVTGTDHLLDAVVSRVQPAAKQILEDSGSCRTTLTNISCSSVPNVLPSYGRLGVSDQIQGGELYGLPKPLAKSGAIGSCSFKSGPSKENSGNYSQSSSIYGSQISSWIEQGHEMKQGSSVSTAYSKKPDEIGKSTRKRLKPGENPRPRPKDRQMIQDRVKELREIVPNGAKCSIDALLERTIKHMLFLQSVTKHADKLKQTGESKIISKEGGLLLKDNFEGGATWAYEVGSQSVVCPIIVEDLNPPRQMLVEMLCEERGLFLEIADIIRGLGLTILKGVMETRNDKIWARFVVEANRDVTRMEIFISLVRLLEQTVKSTAASSANGIDNDNMMVHQLQQAAASIPVSGSFQ